MVAVNLNALQIILCTVCSMFPMLYESFIFCRKHNNDKMSLRRRGVLQPTTRGLLLLGVLLFWVFLSHVFFHEKHVDDNNLDNDDGAWKGAILLMRKKIRSFLNKAKTYIFQVESFFSRTRRVMDLPSGSRQWIWMRLVGCVFRRTTTLTIQKAI